MTILFLDNRYHFFFQQLPNAYEFIPPTINKFSTLHICAHTSRVCIKIKWQGLRKIVISYYSVKLWQSNKIIMYLSVFCPLNLHRIDFGRKVSPWNCFVIYLTKYDLSSYVENLSVKMYTMLPIYMQCSDI